MTCLSGEPAGNAGSPRIVSIPITGIFSEKTLDFFPLLM